MGHLWHLVKRFFGSLVPVGPSGSDLVWVQGLLLPGEATLWRSMDRADRRHSVAVAHRVQRALGADGLRPVLAAGLLHDVGKVVSGLGPCRRVLATVLVKVGGRNRAVAWRHVNGFRGRVGLYADHPAVGADLLAGAGSDPLTVAWAREHHLPERQWTLPLRLASALKAADDD